MQDTIFAGAGGFTGASAGPEDAQGTGVLPAIDIGRVAEGDLGAGRRKAGGVQREKRRVMVAVPSGKRAWGGWRGREGRTCSATVSRLSVSAISPSLRFLPLGAF